MDREAYSAPRPPNTSTSTRRTSSNLADRQKPLLHLHGQPAARDQISDAKKSLKSSAASAAAPSATSGVAARYQFGSPAVGMQQRVHSSTANPLPPYRRTPPPSSHPHALAALPQTRSSPSLPSVAPSPTPEAGASQRSPLMSSQRSPSLGPAPAPPPLRPPRTSSFDGNDVQSELLRRVTISRANPNAQQRAERHHYRERGQSFLGEDLLAKELEEKRRLRLKEGHHATAPPLQLDKLLHLVTQPGSGDSFLDSPKSDPEITPRSNDNELSSSGSEFTPRVRSTSIDRRQERCQSVRLGDFFKGNPLATQAHLAQVQQQTIPTVEQRRLRFWRKRKPSKKLVDANASQSAPQPSALDVELNLVELIMAGSMDKKFLAKISTLNIMQPRPKQLDEVCRVSSDAVLSAPPPHVSPTTQPEPHTYLPALYCSAVSGYPMRSDGSVREGFPIADHYHCQILHSRAILCLADGCGWGVSSAEAARSAAHRFVDYVRERQESIRSVRDAADLLLRACCSAHNCVVEGKEWWEAGTTTLLGGLVLPLTPGHHVFVCLSIGDCKAYRVNGSTVVDITNANRGSLNPRDPGGRLGPYTEAAEPDLRNLSIFVSLCEDSDLLVLCSDGIHDNLDPEILGLQPEQVPAMIPPGAVPRELQAALSEIEPSSNWDQIPQVLAHVLKTTYAEQRLASEVMRPGEAWPVPVDLAGRRLIEHALNAAAATRDYMERCPNSPVTESYQRFPGKMDHISAVCFQIGKHYSADPAASPPAIASPLTAASSPRPGARVSQTLPTPSSQRQPFSGSSPRDLPMRRSRSHETESTIASLTAPASAPANSISSLEQQQQQQQQLAEQMRSLAALLSASAGLSLPRVAPIAVTTACTETDVVLVCRVPAGFEVKATLLPTSADGIERVEVCALPLKNRASGGDGWKLEGLLEVCGVDECQSPFSRLVCLPAHLLPLSSTRSLRLGVDSKANVTFVSIAR